MKIENMSLPNSSRFFENRECAYYPCHKGIEVMNCLFCYCPLYTYKPCPGRPEYIYKDGKEIKSCMNCTFPHQPDHYEQINEILRK